MTGLTESLAHFIEHPGFETLPAEAARIVRNGFIDNVATMIAGRDEPVVRIVRKVGLCELTDKFVAQPQLRELMSRVRTLTTDTHCPVEPIFALTDRVTVELYDGRRLDSGEIRFARGNARLPLKDEELKAKFLDCASGAENLDAAALYDRLDRLGELENLRDLVPGSC